MSSTCSSRACLAIPDDRRVDRRRRPGRPRSRRRTGRTACSRRATGGSRRGRRTSPAARAAPKRRLFRRIADHFIANRSAYSGRSSRRSTHSARLLGSASFSNAATSSGSGRIPQMSSDDRRANSASVQVALGGNAQLAELAEDERVDQVAARPAAPRAGRRRRRDRGPGDRRPGRRTAP